MPFQANAFQATAFQVTVTTQTVSMTGYDGRKNQYGSAAILMQVQPTGQPQQAAVGAPGVQLRATPTGYAESEGFGSPSVLQQVALTGYAESEGFGAPTITPAVWVMPTGLLDDEAGFGTNAVQLGVIMEGVARAPAFGEPTIVLGEPPQMVEMEGFAGVRATGALDVALRTTPVGHQQPGATYGAFAATLMGTMVGATNVHGHGAFAVALAASVSGVAPARAYGQPGAVLVVGAGNFFRTKSAYGEPTYLLQIAPTGYADIEGFGLPYIGIPPPLIEVFPDGFAGVPSFGELAVLLGQVVEMTGHQEMRWVGLPEARLRAAVTGPGLHVNEYGELTTSLTAVLDGLGVSRYQGTPSVALQAILAGLSEHVQGYGFADVTLRVVPLGRAPQAAYGAYAVSGDVIVEHWRLEPGDNQLRIDAPTGAVYALVTPRGRVVAWGMADGTVVAQDKPRGWVKGDVVTGAVRER